MDQLVQILHVANAVMIVALPALLWIGSRWFAPRDQTSAAFKSVREEFKAVREEISAVRSDLPGMEARLRQDMNNQTSNISAHSIQQYSGLTAQIGDVKRALDLAQERAHEAHSVAVAAMHKAERAEDKIVALDRLINTRLDSLTSQMHGVENLLKQYASDVKELANRRGIA